jgi:hypothetical protein
MTNAETLQKAAPRLIKIVTHIAISFATWHGTRRALVEVGDEFCHNAKEIAYSCFQDSASMTVIRVNLLLTQTLQWSVCRAFTTA